MNPIVDRDVYERIVSDTAGSTDMVPHYDMPDGKVKIPAAWLIEQTGWKGRDLGPAGVYERQALVLVNRGGATGNDILTLCHNIRDDVQARFGITLQPEVCIIGH